MRWIRLHRLLVSLALCLIASSASSTSLVHLTPEQVDEAAERIFEGRCVSARTVSLDGVGFPVTEYVFAVDRALKGEALRAGLAQADGQLTFRQAGGTRPDGTQYFIVGLPSYSVGGHYRIALRGDSVLGLTSPVGFGQGVRTLRLPPRETQPAANASSPRDEDPRP